MKKLDKYIISKFLGTFFYTIILFSAVSVVIDLSDRIDDFLEKGISLSMIITAYYWNFIPHIIFLLSPLFIFIAVIFFTSRLASRSEIIAILASGISFYRLLFVPYFISAFVLVGIQLYANHYLVPNANKARFDFEYTYLKGRYVNRDRNIHMQISPDTYVYMQSFNNRTGTGNRFTLEQIQDKQLIYKLSARRIKWDKEEEHWTLQNYHARAIDGLKETLSTGKEMDTILNLHPSEFEQRIRFKEAMTTPELTAFIAKEVAKGKPNVEFYQVEKHRRTSNPFATFILTAMGLAIASRKTRGGLGSHIFKGIALGAFYLVVLQFSTTFATNGTFSPLISVWVPNILFSFLAIYLVLKAPK